MDGVITKHINESDRYLRAVEVPTIDEKLCDNAYKAYGGVTDRMFCAGYYEQGGKDGECSMIDLLTTNHELFSI